MVSAAIIPIQNLLVWGPDYLYWFYISPDITAEKISIGVIILGLAFVTLGYKKADSLYSAR
ncbi:hypothetical protein QVH35_05300 [Candidatus Nitrosotenuis chungbukensis]|uniref:hypothetical protein n=1 Tax=Candidatus Nitrosotenuis chungbukensis TaxID=1353246 RepID=UPI000693631E|nr:hypothetical protein [Candidatus Nitrosotenuis chungbukensis]WKT58746.1 hypothetical protein QVH35_05300 [Candidatus Nitrosotenuis chungbukensis]